MMEVHPNYDVKVSWTSDGAHDIKITETTEFRVTEYFLPGTTRRHRIEGPAYISENKTKGLAKHVWYIDNYLISKSLVKYITNPKTITLEFALSQKNLTKRMLLIKYGRPEMLIEKATLVDETTDEKDMPVRLWSYEMKNSDRRSQWEPETFQIKFLEVNNHTPPHERFLIFVPREMVKASEALAWTFPVEESGYEYKPFRSS